MARMMTRMTRWLDSHDSLARWLDSHDSLARWLDSHDSLARWLAVCQDPHESIERHATGHRYIFPMNVKVILDW